MRLLLLWLLLPRLLLMEILHQFGRALFNRSVDFREESRAPPKKSQVARCCHYQSAQECLSRVLAWSCCRRVRQPTAPVLMFCTERCQASLLPLFLTERYQDWPSCQYQHYWRSSFWYEYCQPQVPLMWIIFVTK